MAYTDTELRRIYDRTGGYCHICGKKLSFTNYGCAGEKGAWHVEHSVPRAKGGTDHGNNLYAACINCNLEKDTFTTKTARGWNGRSRAPLSRVQRKRAQASNTAGGALIGGLIGLAVGGPVVGALGAIGGAAIGKSIKPK